MRLLSEIKKNFSAEGSAFRVQYTVVDGGGGYFQNVKKLKEFSPQRIVLGGGKGSLTIEGQNLSLGKYFQGDLVVHGTICKVERSD